MNLFDLIIAGFATFVLLELLTLLGIDMNDFWQIAGMVLMAIQLYLYIEGFNNHRKRLEQLAEDLRGRANEKFAAYKDLRDKDPDFYDYYKSLPDYTECVSNIKRSKGAAFFSYGQQLRRTLPTVRGYLPMQKAALANLLGGDPVYRSSMKRVQTKIAERSRVDDHVLERWQAIVSAPTNPSAVQDYGVLINSSFKSLQAFGQAANASLYTAGISLHRMGF